jgi:hypothetical protein
MEFALNELGYKYCYGIRRVKCREISSVEKNIFYILTVGEFLK